jgi:N-methylhydantoinase A
VGFQPGAAAPQSMRERFVAEYLKTYGYRDETPIELVKLRLIGRGLRDRRLDFAAISASSRRTADSAGTRGVSFDRGRDFTPTRIVSRQAVDREAAAGPLIVDEFDATIVVPPDARVWRDGAGSIVMELGGGR